MPGVFISYRREDSAGHTGRLFDRLRARLGHDRVFMDITGIEAGVDFVDTIERAIGSCDVLLAVIGPEWLSCPDSRGQPRLQDPGDLIRVEIAAALTRNVRVIPVLIAGASMPPAPNLPEDLRPLARRQAAELRDTRWDADINELIAVLERVLASSSSARPAPSSDHLRTIPAPSPRDPVVLRSADRGGRQRSPSRRWVTAAGLVLIAGLAAAAIFDVRNRQTEVAPRAENPQIVVVPATAPAAPPSAAAVEAPAPNPAPPAPAVPERTRVPRVEGLTLQLAVRALRAAGLAVGTEQSAAAPGVSPFVVTKQTPPAGSFAPRSGRVDLVYARPGRTLPALTGRTLDEAVAELRDLGFVPGALTTSAADGVPAGQVIRQSPEAGVSLEPGTKVDLVSAAPRPTLTVPNIVGLDVTSATATLQRAGLVVKSRRYRPSADVPPGQIVSQDPDAGAAIDKGGGVALVYASRRGLKVPDVNGLPTQEARSRLAQSGFTAKVRYEASDRTRPDTVIRQSPPAGSASVNDDPAVELVIALLPASAARLVIHYTADVERSNAQNLAAFLAPYKLERYDVSPLPERSILSGAGVHYPRAELERLAQSLASRTQTWLSGAYGRPITLTPRLEPRLRGNIIVIYLPNQN